MPLLLLVIDNYFAFGENYESLEGDITTLLRSGFRMWYSGNCFCQPYE